MAKCKSPSLLLRFALHSRPPPFDVDLVFSDIKAGLDFLHSLGLVHDDINPRNVMLDDDGHAIIIMCLHRSQIAWRHAWVVDVSDNSSGRER